MNIVSIVTILCDGISHFTLFQFQFLFLPYNHSFLEINRAPDFPTDFLLGLILILSTPRSGSWSTERLPLLKAREHLQKSKSSSVPHETRTKSFDLLEVGTDMVWYSACQLYFGFNNLPDLFFCVCLCADTCTWEQWSVQTQEQCVPMQS